MMKRVMASATILAFAVPSLAMAGSGCQTDKRDINGVATETKICIVPSGAFKPNHVIAAINGKKVFKGTDYADVDFKGSYKQQRISGGCVESVVVMEMATMKAAPVASLPPDLVSACHISADANGGSMPFAKDAACGKVFSSALIPLLGKIVPTSDSRRCTLSLDGVEVFSKDFR